MTKTFHKPIPFIDLGAQQAHLKDRIDQNIQTVMKHGHYIMGPEIKELEDRLKTFTGAKHCLSCSSGTDALALILMAKGLRPGDAVFVPSFTFAATAEVVAWLGATAIFIDSDPKSFNIDPQDLKRAIQWAQENKLNAKGIITVDLFGLPADYDAIEYLANEHNLWIIDDAAQGLGGIYKNRKIGTIGLATATSFFPAKPLGCYGDGGAIFTDDDALIEILRSLRVHGKGTDKYDNIRIGMNGRFDTLQAAILLPKLDIFPEELHAREEIALRYNNALKDHVQVPTLPDDITSAWAQYTILLPPSTNRNELTQSLKERGIPTAVYYPKPLHQQTAYQNFGRATQNLTVCETLSARVLSLPMHPYLETDTQDYIIENFISCVA